MPNDAPNSDPDSRGHGNESARYHARLRKPATATLDFDELKSALLSFGTSYLILRLSLTLPATCSNQKSRRRSRPRTAPASSLASTSVCQSSVAPVAVSLRII